MKIYCVIPAFNEKGNLQKLTEKLEKSLKKEKVIYKILYVIQGEDGSLDLIKKLRKQNSKIDYLYFQKPLGIGIAYKKGFQKVNTNFTHVLTCDADLNHDPKDIPQFIKTIKATNSDIVVGSRFIKGGRSKDRRTWKRISSFLTNFIITKLTGINVHDITSGYRLIKTEVVKKVEPQLLEKNYPFYMEFIILSQKLGFSVKEVPICYTPRTWGESKMLGKDTFLDYLNFAKRLFRNFE